MVPSGNANKFGIFSKYDAALLYFTDKIGLALGGGELLVKLLVFD